MFSPSLLGSNWLFSLSKAGWAPHPPLSANWFQETARFFVGHNTVVPSFLVAVKFHEVSLPCSLQFFLIAVFSHSVALCNVHCPSLHPSITVEHPHCPSAALSPLSFLTTSYNIPTALILQHPHFLFITSSSSLPFHYHIPIFFSLHHSSQNPYFLFIKSSAMPFHSNIAIFFSFTFITTSPFSFHHIILTALPWKHPYCPSL